MSIPFKNYAHFVLSVKYSSGIRPPPDSKSESVAPSVRFLRNGRAIYLRSVRSVLTPSPLRALCPRTNSPSLVLCGNA